MIKILSWRSLCTYLSHPKFFWGLLLDICILPLAGLMIVLKYLFKQDFDNFFSHPLHLPPILLIHGSGSNEAQWLLSRFWIRNRFNVYSVQLPQNAIHSIDEFIPIIHEKMKFIQSSTSKPVFLVGHSMGGLVAALYAETYPSHQIRKIITISSPWQGAPVLEHLSIGTKRHHQMAPGSVFLQKLQTLVDKSIHKYVCIGSDYDVQVPFSNSHPSSSSPHITLVKVPYGHYSIIFFPTIWNNVV